ncbi:MAG: hypothetical protein AAFQ67_01200 [Pseudomonadota bacterium]
MKTLVLPAALVGLSPIGAAQTSDVTGVWSFEAEIGADCSFVGQAQFTSTVEETVYGCALTARQSCPDIGLDMVVAQDCRAERDGDTLMIVSEIREFLKGDPTPFYYPDNFALEIQSSDRMTGWLLWAENSEPAEFVRDIGAIS